jgi:hypothetical protein
MAHAVVSSDHDSEICSSRKHCMTARGAMQ